MFFAWGVMALPVWYHALSGGMGMMSLPIWSRVPSRRGYGPRGGYGPTDGYGPKGMVQGGMVPEVGIPYPHTGI